jgi:ABC-type cobalamin transport system permease subunit
MGPSTKLVVVVLELILIAAVWGSFAWWYPGNHFPFKFELFVWSLLFCVTLNSLLVVFHVTRWHYGEHHAIE